MLSIGQSLTSMYVLHILALPRISHNYVLFAFFVDIQTVALFCIVFALLQFQRLEICSKIEFQGSDQPAAE